MSFLVEFNIQHWQVTVEDDGKVCYAYLIVEDQIVSDVWLYNCGPAPMERPWNVGGEMPFENPAEYLAEGEGERHLAGSEITVDILDQVEGDMEVEVRIDGVPTAWLTPGARPGWSALVARDGPLAKVRRVGEGD